ncbi:MAG: DUF5043 domain-containing protein [Odoribacteraceae bacterium]|jgi:hypothetical protein|nr:DUF5043 domain-containing protein [Odoribacteraceae bacterium]
MTRTLLTAICLLLVGSLCAQTFDKSKSYYTTTQTIQGSGFKLQCDIYKGFCVTLYDVNSKFTYAKWGKKDGTNMELGVSRGTIPTTENDTWTRSKSISIVDNTFSFAEKEWVKGEMLLVTMIIDSSTGKVIEVNFEFDKDTPFQQIPPTTFHKIEQQLKTEIWFTVTPAGKELTYCMAHWMHEFE